MATRRKKEDVRAAILDAAGTLFHQRGYDRTSMKVIAERIGITAQGLYWHFDSKEAILASYLEAGLEHLVAECQKALALDDPVDQLREFARRHVSLQVESLETSLVFDSAVYGANQLRLGMKEQDEQRLVNLERQHLNTLRNILDAGVRQGHFHVESTSVTAFAIIGIGEHVIHWYRPDGPRSIEEVADMLAELVVRMATARP